MDKKGFTMTELMVSIAIIAVVMVFLVKMLIDVRYDNRNELYDTKNQINRAEIIKTIQNDLYENVITSINDSGSADNELVININAININTNSNTSAKIEAVTQDGEEYIKYKSTSNKNYKWMIERNNKETYIKKNDIVLSVIECSNEGKTEKEPNCDTQDKIIRINIPIIIDNSTLRRDNDSQMDNIILTFYNHSGYGIETTTLNPE